MTAAANSIGSCCITDVNWPANIHVDVNSCAVKDPRREAVRCRGPKAGAGGAEGQEGGVRVLAIFIRAREFFSRV